MEKAPFTLEITNEINWQAMTFHFNLGYILFDVLFLLLRPIELSSSVMGFFVPLIRCSWDTEAQANLLIYHLTWETKSRQTFVPLAGLSPPGLICPKFFKKKKLKKWAKLSLYGVAMSPLRHILIGLRYHQPAVE